MNPFKTHAAASVRQPDRTRLAAQRCRALPRWSLTVAGAALLFVGGCALPDKPVRAAMFDFGPGVLSAQGAVGAPAAAIAIDDIGTAGGALENMAVLYRLAYLDDQQLRPYSQARWSMPPAQLIRQRLREQLSLSRPVFNARDSLALSRKQAAAPASTQPDRAAPLPLQLRLELEEFSHLFTAPEVSMGLVRLRATLVEVTSSGEKLVGQRSVVVQRPAATPDAAGGVRALTAATDAAIVELDQWLLQAAAGR